VEAVLHLAAKVGLGVDVQDLPDYASSNDAGTAVLLAAMARAGVTRLTLASSMVVYGEGLGHCGEHGTIAPAPRTEGALSAGRFEPPCPHCGEPLAPALVSEDTPLDPRNAYASSKVAQEFYAANWARATGGSVAALRYHNVYGPGMPRDTPYAGVAAIFTSALRRGEAPKVFEDGGQRRDFVHVGDVAAATVLACEKHVSGVRAFNVGSGTPRTVGDMARALAKTLCGPQPVITGHYRLGDVRHITADSSRLRAELGWAPRFSFADGMAELARAG
jgi:dTDP-L-rhamnose 4-epimerase